MRPVRIAAAAGLLIAALTACGPDTPSAPASAGTPTSAAAASGSGAAAGAATTLDPCQIVTQQEASALTGVSYAAGKQLQGQLSKSCLYGSGTKNVFRVDVVQGTIDQIHQYRDQVTAEIDSGDAGGHFTKNSVAGLGDEATAYALSGSVLNVSSLFVVKSTVALYLVNQVAGTAVSTTALTDAARTALGRMP